LLITLKAICVKIKSYLFEQNNLYCCGNFLTVTSAPHNVKSTNHRDLLHCITSGTPSEYSSVWAILMGCPFDPEFEVGGVKGEQIALLVMTC
jgi:hypothetical protein